MSDLLCGHLSPGGGLTCQLPPHRSGGHVWVYDADADNAHEDTEEGK